MKTIKNQVAVEATIAERVRTAAFGSLMAAVAVCFPRRDSRMLGRAMTQGMLMELERRNCWTLADALGHDGPHRLQHFLSRGAWNHDLARDRLAAWAAAELADDEAVLIVDETGDEKSSTDCVGASHQYSGALGGVGLCQVAVHLTCASPRGHALIDRELYLPAAWAEDEERRLLRHVPDEVTFATKPQLAAAMLHRARRLGLPTRWFTGDEVYGSLELRHTARTLGFDYALAVRADHRASTAAGRFSATEPAAKVPARAWMRRRTGNGTKGDRHYDWALIDILADDAPAGRDEAGHAFLVVRRHRYTRELSFYRCHPHRRHNRTRPSTRPGQQPRTPGRPADHRTPHAPPRPRARPALVCLAPSPPTPGHRGPPPMEQHHRGGDHMTGAERSRLTAAVSDVSSTMQGHLARVLHRALKDNGDQWRVVKVSTRSSAGML